MSIFQSYMNICIYRILALFPSSNISASKDIHINIKGILEYIDMSI